MHLVQAEFGGHGPDLGLMQASQGKQQLCQLGLGELVQEVGLIFFRVQAGKQVGAAVDSPGQPGIVAGGQPVAGL